VDGTLIIDRVVISNYWFSSMKVGNLEDEIDYMLNELKDHFSRPQPSILDLNNALLTSSSSNIIPSKLNPTSSSSLNHDSKYDMLEEEEDDQLEDEEIVDFNADMYISNNNTTTPLLYSHI